MASLLSRFENVKWSKYPLPPHYLFKIVFPFFRRLEGAKMLDFLANTTPTGKVYDTNGEGFTPPIRHQRGRLFDSKALVLCVKSIIAFMPWKYLDYGYLHINKVCMYVEKQECI